MVRALYIFVARLVVFGVVVRLVVTFELDVVKPSFDGAVVVMISAGVVEDISDENGSVLKRALDFDLIVFEL